MFNPNSWNPVYVIVGTLVFFGVALALTMWDALRHRRCDLCYRPYAIFTAGRLELCRDCNHREAKRSKLPKRKAPIGRVAGR